MLVIHNRQVEELIKSCADNNRLAQKQLYEKYYGKLMGVCMRYAESKDDATFILNNAFYKIFKNIEQFVDKPGNFEGWMYRITVNAAIDYVRQELKHRHLEIEKSVYVQDHSADAVSEMAVEELLALITKLSPAYRAVFNLYVVEGFNHKEIGEMLGISEGTSKSNLAKARARLQEMIQIENDIKLRQHAK